METNWLNILILFFSFASLIISFLQMLKKSRQSHDLNFSVSPTTTDQNSELNDLPIAIYKIDPIGEVIECNKAYYQLTGFESDSLKRNWLSLVNPQDFDKIKLERNQCINQSKNFEVKTKLKRKNGEFIWTQITETPIREAHGNLIYYRGCIVNIHAEVRNKELMERFQTGLDQVQILTITDNRGFVTYANDSFCKISKYSVDEIVGRKLSLINSGYHRANFFKNLWNTINAGDVWKGEICNKTKTGSLFWLKTTIMPLTDSLGSPTQFIALSHDITSQKLWERQVLEAKANAESMSHQLTAIVSVAPDAIVVANKEGQIIEFNPSAEKVFGFNREEIVGCNIADTIIPPQFQTTHKDGLQRYLATRKEKILNTIIEITAYKKSQKEFPIDLIVTPFEFNGETYFAAYIRDITARKESQESLKKTYEKIEFENKIWRVIDRVGLNLLVLNNEGDMLEMLLQIVCEDLGWDIAQIYLKTVNDKVASMTYKHSHSVNTNRYKSFIQSSKSAVFSLGQGIPGGVWKSGSPFWITDINERPDFPCRDAAVSENIISCLGVPIFVNNEIYGVLEVFTEKKLKEDSSMIRGMTVIASYFSKAIERQLQQKKEAEYHEQLAKNAKLSSMGEMAGGIAHEINNPLTVIKGHSKNILKILESDNIDTEKIKQSTIKINNTLDRIVKIVKGLKNISREGSGDPFLLTMVKHILDDALSLCETKVKNANVNLRLIPHHDHLGIECRSFQISQILINLINNAVDAIEKMEERWIEIEIHDLNENVEIWVTDSGKGIPDEVADKITQAFFTTKEFGKGTGLGLSITKGIIEAHHGEFGLMRKHQNTRFFIKLPKNQANQQNSSQGSNQGSNTKNQGSAA